MHRDVWVDIQAVVVDRFAWNDFNQQFKAGLNMVLSGITYWTTDIGGFGGGNTEDPDFRELIVRWFQWGAFCPLFRAVHSIPTNA